MNSGVLTTVAGWKKEEMRIEPLLPHRCHVESFVDFGPGEPANLTPAWPSPPIGAPHLITKSTNCPLTLAQTHLHKNEKRKKS